jgi:hypothetical protein
MAEEYGSNGVKFEECECIKATGKAILVLVDGDPQWIPQSQVHEDSEVYCAGDVGDLIVKRWFAEKEGMI